MIKAVYKRLVTKLPHGQRGALMLGVLVIGLTLTIIAVSLMSFTSSTYTLAVKSTYAANAMLVAEAAIETSLHQLNDDVAFAGYTTEQMFFDNVTQGKGVYTSVVQDTADSNAKTITATGKIYRYGSTTEVIDTKRIKVTVVGTASDGYSVHTGPGGLILSGSANVLNSDVFVNGYLTMNGSARIGSNSQPRNVFVANSRCPTGTSPGPTYPQVCASGVGGQPVAISGSARIYGTVCATGQTDSTGILPGNGGAGLQAGCVAPPVQPPVYDRGSHIAAVTTTAASNNATYACSGSQNKTWPANLRLNGNVSLGNSCTLTVSGNVYITGNLTLGGSLRLRVADSVGTTRPTILVDGSINANGSAQVISNNVGTSLQFVSAKATASCNPNCTALSGNDLKNSQNVTTIDIGGSTSVAGVIFLAQWGKVILGGSGNVGALGGQTVDLSGSGNVVFGTTLSSGTTTWTISSYQRLFD